MDKLLYKITVNSIKDTSNAISFYYTIKFYIILL